MNIKPKSRQIGIVVQELESEFLIYDLIINKAFCLNETSTIIYQLCDGTKAVAEISDLMSKKLQTIVSEDFVWLTLNELKKENLLENGDDFETKFAGLSRREVVKKIGFASMIALPVIASIVAPSALMAQSGLRPIGVACTTSPQCASGNCFPSIRSGVVCCSATTTTAGLAPGDPVQSFIPAVGCVADCNPVGQQYCCSGVGSFLAAPTGTCGPGLTFCQCK